MLLDYDISILNQAIYKEWQIMYSANRVWRPTDRYISYKILIIKAWNSQIHIFLIKILYQNNYKLLYASL